MYNFQGSNDLIPRDEPKGPPGALFKGSKWDLETVEPIRAACEVVAREELGLDVYPIQIEVISSEQMLDAYASIGMPIMYRHWSFGKLFAYHETLYKKGLQGLAYEIVINSNPVICYIMEENSATMQTLVIAHAGYGHNHFFKNNYLFRQWTDASGILDYLSFARDYVAKCEERYGEEAVERTLDAAHTLREHIGRHKRKRISFAEEKARREARRTYEEEHYNDLWVRTIPDWHKPAEEPAVEKADYEAMRLPEENLLYFLEKRSPRLKGWQRELLRIVRTVSEYFYPQKQLQMMNEGCATFVHYYIMNRLYEKGLLSEGHMLEFLHSHSSVIFQPDFDDPRFTGINPYALGFAMMTDIARMCNGYATTHRGLKVPCTSEQLAEDREWFPDIAGNGDPFGTLRDAWANYRDESFILQYLSPAVMRQFRFFVVDDDHSKPHRLVEAIHNASGYRRVREALAAQYDLGKREPEIVIVAADEATHALVLEHCVYDGVRLEKKRCQKVLEHVAFLWGYRGVRLVERDAVTDEVLEIFSAF